jgi:hypothetical protein
MAIYDPRLFLSSEDKELLRLLSELLLDLEAGDLQSNRGVDRVPLSAPESSKLLELLEQFVSSRKFQEGSYFIERLFGSDSLYDNRLRDIYLKWRKWQGRSRSVAWIQWENFLGRLGLWTNKRDNPAVWYRASAQPMDMHHFLRMEQRLATAADLHPRVQAIVLKFVSARISALDKIRRGEARLDDRQVRNLPKGLLDELKHEYHSATGVAPISTAKLTGILTIVMDFSALYTTRDWSVASVLSATAGALPSVTLE